MKGHKGTTPLCSTSPMAMRDLLVKVLVRLGVLAFAGDTRRPFVPLDPRLDRATPRAQASPRGGKGRNRGEA
jgi:hypothetical protein